MAEEWRDVVDFEGWYQISNLGRVRNKHGRILKTYISRKKKGEYLRIRLRKNTVKKHFSIHRLVADAFLDPAPSIDAEVHHKIGKSNNVNNLEWLTPNQHRARHVKSNWVFRLKKFFDENLCPCCLLSVKEFLKNEKGPLKNEKDPAD